MQNKNHRILNMMKKHFINNPDKLFSVKYFIRKYDISYIQALYRLNLLYREGLVLKFYLSAWQSCRAWGVPHPIFSLFVLNPFKDNPFKNKQFIKPN